MDTANALGYADPVISQSMDALGGLGAATDPYTFAALSDFEQDRILERMTPAQVQRLYRDIEALVAKGGLGNLSGFFSKILKKVGNVVKKVAPIATAVLPLIPGGATVGTILNAAQNIIGPQQTTQATPAPAQQVYTTQTFPAPKTELPGWVLPVGLVAVVLLATRR
jgi:hypothetical protein